MWHSVMVRTCDKNEWGRHGEGGVWGQGWKRMYQGKSISNMHEQSGWVIANETLQVKEWVYWEEIMDRKTGNVSYWKVLLGTRHGIGYKEGSRGDRALDKFLNSTKITLMSPSLMWMIWCIIIMRVWPSNKVHVYTANCEWCIMFTQGSCIISH